ncbi:MAG TPA: transposase [Desulfohalobiaceae bacterium]|nr:transposase [Desulfohalobiaceae bacterium]
MSRIGRFVSKYETSVYHVISRTALQGLPIEDADKDHLLHLIQYYSKIFFFDVLGFAIMGNHFHLVCRTYPESEVSDEDVVARYKIYRSEDGYPSQDNIDYYRSRWTSLSEYVKDIKQEFTRYFNRKHGRKGYFWGERFKSLIVEEGHTLVNLLAYVDLNAIRAGIVKKPEEYRWCSLGYHVQTGNKDGLLDVDFGLKEWHEFDEKEIVRKYREFVYETGAVNAGKGAVIDLKIVKQERKCKYELSRQDRFLYRSRYFTDAGIIGSKDFVKTMFDRFKHLLNCNPERKFTPIGGVEGVYSMKRLV